MTQTQMRPSTDVSQAPGSRRQLWIDGAWCTPHSEATVAVTNPATGVTIGVIPAADRIDVARAVEAADRAFDGWAATPLAERLDYLGRLGDLVEAHADDFADVLTAETGMTRILTRHVQVPFALEVLRSSIDIAANHTWETRVGHSLVRQEPAGVVAAITPWNAPLVLLMQKLVPALAAGCTVVLKPSELAPLNTYLLIDLIAELGLPAGVVNMVPGTGEVAGEALAADPAVAVVSLTGSQRAGRRVGELAAQRFAKVALELGGKSASIVLDDFDLATAVGATVEQVTFNAGQVCFAWSRLLVPADRYEEALAIAGRAASSMSVGDPMLPQTQVGPVIHAEAQRRIIGMIDEAVANGARLVCGGRIPAEPTGGYFVLPTVIGDVAPDSRIAREEVFGPVLVVIPYQDEEDALRIADATDYGLAGAVWSADVARATEFARRLRTGRIDVNGAPFNMHAPFGGYKGSGNGRELGRWGLEEFCETKAIQLPPDSADDTSAAIKIRAADATGSNVG